ncbi:MAG TPA: hypothetical protein VK733_10060 [Gemmatimonadaceae bacterium]|jgi:hypothetical protein|nr:hypothetical protein [Gemmatimonadaceae bacterium]
MSRIADNTATLPPAIEWSDRASTDDADKYVQRLLAEMSSRASGTSAAESFDGSSIQPQATTITAVGNASGKVRARLNQILDLADGWDGYGASRIDPAVTGVVDAFLGRVRNTLSIDPAIVATGNGSVQLEWRSGPNELDVQLWPDGEVTLLFEQRDSAIAEDWSGPLDDLSQIELERVLFNFKPFAG